MELALTRRRWLPAANSRGLRCIPRRSFPASPTGGIMPNNERTTNVGSDLKQKREESDVAHST